MKILYICTHNRCRSILSEAITNHHAQGIIEARSAGSQPAGEVHPLSLQYLQETGYAVDGLQSQSWDEFEDFAPDLVVTVCDSAAGETCPLWFGKSTKVHWGLADPSKLQGSDEQKKQAFLDCIEQIKTRVQALVEIARSQPDQKTLIEQLANLGAQ
ncbi:arsenate reductase ArsC [Planctobacterium marinum]|uniref:Protein-tyrosine-phosphatase n=1 Tax=Planctobacterium marinum TaxID=1631968 RepID=A0AA48HWL5_9ALTE|nr:protein-tyrosine-phosphatase [Planctobacterium marinum]